MIRTDFSDYKFRCHALGKIMVGVNPPLTNPQEKELIRLKEKQEAGKITELQLVTLGSLLEKKHAKPVLSKTVQTYLKELHREELYSRRKDIRGKYLDKGIQGEEKSITLYSKVNNVFYIKNKERFSDEFKSGEPDNKTNKIREIKTSWSFSTFPMYEETIPNSDYDWQIQGYLDLTGLSEGELIYCLIDTPFKLIDDELRRMDWQHDIMDGSGDIRPEKIDLVVETISDHIFSEDGLNAYCLQSPIIQREWFTEFKSIPDELRVRTFDVKKDEEKIKSLHNQIELCRVFLNDLSLSIAEKLNVTI